MIRLSSLGRRARPAAWLALPLALVAAPALARPTLAPPTTPIPGAALERALATVEVPELSADVYFLASDELGGRDSPSAGLRIAARYIRARLQRLGWQPGAGDGYFQRYELKRTRVSPSKTGMRVTHGGEELALAYGTDYVFHPRSLWDGSVQGGLVFCGSGGEEDFARAEEVRGRWALCWDDGDWRGRDARAKEAGAVGVIVTSSAGDDEPATYTERYSRWVDSAREGSMRAPAEEAGFPTVYMNRAATDRVLALAGAQKEPAVGGRIDAEVTETRGAESPAGIELENVCGFWPGNDPELSKEVILLSAHYDHVGTSSQGEIFNGADDNASGTSALLGLAEALTEYGPMRRSVMLIWVSAEEKGLLGSRAWTLDPTIPEGYHAVADINIDMVGRNAPDSLLITPTKDHFAHNGLVELAERLSPQEGFPKLGSCDDYWNRSDQANFERNLKIPVTFLFSDVHEDYHRPTDTPDKIDYDKIRRVTRLVLRMLDAMQSSDLDPEHGWFRKAG